MGAWLALVLPPKFAPELKLWVAKLMPEVDVHEIVQTHRRYLVELMQEWTRLKEYAGDRDLSFTLVVDAELFRLDSVVRWLDAAEGRIKRAAFDSTTSSLPGLPKLPRRVGVKR